MQNSRQVNTILRRFFFYLVYLFFFFYSAGLTGLIAKNKFSFWFLHNILRLDDVSGKVENQVMASEVCSGMLVGNRQA